MRVEHQDLGARSGTYSAIGRGGRVQRTFSYTTREPRARLRAGDSKSLAQAKAPMWMMDYERGNGATREWMLREEKGSQQ